VLNRKAKETGYRNTRVGWIPADWSCERADSSVSCSNKKGDNELPLYSVTLDSGLIRRDSLDRKIDSELEGEDCLLVKKGDLTYNTMRLWQGAIGLAEEDCTVSPAYVVIKPGKQTFPKFLYYLFKTPLYLYLFKSYSYGLTNDRLRLYPKDFSMIPLVKPSIPEQKKIAEILSTWDAAIEKLEKLIALQEKRKRGLMQQLLTGKKRLPGFGKATSNKNSIPAGWSKKALIELGNFSKGTAVLKDKLQNSGIPCILYGDLYTKYNYTINKIQSYLETETYNVDAIVRYGDVLFAGSGETAEEIGKSAVILSKDPIIIGGDIIILSNHDQDPIFLGFALESHPVRKQKSLTGQGHSIVHIYSSSLQNIEVLLPSVEEQSRIGEILQSTEEMINTSKQILNTHNKQKQALMQKLLSGEVRVKHGQ